MRITFVSNYINHHQIPFSDALYAKLGEGYHFIQTQPMEAERVQMGWGLDARQLPYVKFLYEDEYACRRLIAESDVVLMGWTECPGLLDERLRSGKLILRISERLYREGQWKAVSPRGLAQKYQDHTRYRKAPVYLLCAGAYVPSDFHLVHAYPGKMFRFGYFPEKKVYTREQLLAMKQPAEEIQLVWAGRFLPLKHPEYAVRLAEELKRGGYNFHIHMIGSGQMEEELTEMIRLRQLKDKFTMYGFLEPDAVRRVMERGHIFMFTSNQLEGWGAVVNEAMNSGCAVVANSQAGAVPYLIRHMENGLVYREGNYGDFERQVKYLYHHREQMIRFGQKAYDTIATQWNAQVAADRLLDFYENWKAGKLDPPGSGPFSVAPVIKPSRMYESIMDGKL